VNKNRPATGSAAPPDPPQDQPQDQAGKPMPEGIASILVAARILAAYGRHLAAVFPQRGLWPGFATVARFLCNDSFSDTLARIHRGILRALALERLLLKRAARGRDLRVLARPSRFTILTPGADDPFPPEPAAAPRAEARRKEGPHYASNRVSDRRPIWIELLPTLAEVEKEVARRPIGRTIAAICLDLGVAPSLCAGWFWSGLFEVMECLRGSVTQVMLELRRREAQFEREDWKYPRGLPPPARCQETVRQVMGFCIGEVPVDPFRPAVSPYPQPEPGTGPPCGPPA
jgi:hypothetical protein